MTLGSLMSWGGFGKTPAVHHQPIERYHSAGSYWEHRSHGRGKSSKGSGGGAALSALTLLAFLFLINVMQQSLQENNSTMTPVTPATAVLLREGQQQVSVNGREETGQKLETSISSSRTVKSKSKKGDTLPSSLNGQIYVIPYP